MYEYAGEKNELLVTGEKATAGIFATYPGPHLTILNGFFDQVSNCKLVTNLQYIFAFAFSYKLFVFLENPKTLSVLFLNERTLLKYNFYHAPLGAL